MSMCDTGNIAGFAISDVSDVYAVAVLLKLIHCWEIATVADASVFHAAVAATESNTAKTMSNTANIAGFAISDVCADSSIAAA